jgi:hypothetical protein
VVEGIVGSTGMEIKNDPGVPLVYAGFGALMITTLISYVSHSQVGGLCVCGPRTAGAHVGLIRVLLGGF